jgi:hypothetical protein
VDIKIAVGMALQEVEERIYGKTFNLAFELLLRYSSLIIRIIKMPYPHCSLNM